MSTKYDEVANELPFPTDEDSAGMSYMSLRWLAAANGNVPRWWSYTRDSWLRDFWKKVDLLGVTTSTFTSKATTIPIKVRPKDYSIAYHIEQAQLLQNNLQVQSGIMNGWKVEFKKFVVDYLTQDNGAFMLLMGSGPADGPIVGPISGVFHLDSQKCKRTADREYPVVYQHSDGKLYKLHYTRIIAISNMPSPDVEFNGVGYCPVSICIMAAQEILDIATHSAEKFGSRPTRQILYVKKGATLDQLLSAIKVGTAKINSENLEVFSKTLLLAPKSAISELELDTVDLTSVPDGFDRMDSTLLDVAVAAAAFGLDMNDISMAFRTQGTSNENNAEIQDKKGRGKGVGDLLETFAQIMNQKGMPKHLEFSFDNQDDEQDEQQANIWNTRSQARERDLRSGATTVRAERERMLDMHEISEDLFATMELSDGRLPDGTDVAYLFYTDDPYISGLLTLDDVENPTQVAKNDPYFVIEQVEGRIPEVWRAMNSARTVNLSRKAKQAMAALESLKAMYEGEIARIETEEQMMQEEQEAPFDESTILDDEEVVESYDEFVPEEPEAIEFSTNGTGA